MTEALEPIRGEVRIELSDLLATLVAWNLKRLGLMLLVVGAALAGLFWWSLRSLDLAPGQLGPAERAALFGSLRLALVQMGGLTLALVAVFLLLRAVVLPWIALRRLGRDRRTLTWTIDETGIRRRDALGEENLLPWSNIRRVQWAERVIWLTVEPRGRRYLLARAFTPQDHERLRTLAARMVQG